MQSTFTARDIIDSVHGTSQFFAITALQLCQPEHRQVIIAKIDATTHYPWLLRIINDHRESLAAQQAAYLKLRTLPEPLQRHLLLQVSVYAARREVRTTASQWLRHTYNIHGVIGI